MPTFPCLQVGVLNLRGSHWFPSSPSSCSCTCPSTRGPHPHFLVSNSLTRKLQVEMEASLPPLPPGLGTPSWKSQVSSHPHLAAILHQAIFHESDVAGPRHSPLPTSCHPSLPLAGKFKGKKTFHIQPCLFLGPSTGPDPARLLKVVAGQGKSIFCHCQ